MDNWKHKILVLTGILSCVCRWDPSVFPKAILFALCFVPLIYTVSHTLSSHKLLVNLPLTWYGVFLILVVLSLIYTANQIDAFDAVRRCLLSFLLVFVFSQNISEKKDFFCILIGFVFGGVLSLLVAFINEYSLIGSGRLGVVTCGAATTFSSILLIGFSSSFFLIHFWQKKIFYLFVAIFVFGIVLSGSRMPLIIMAPIYVIFSLSKSKNLLKIVKKAFFVCAIIAIGAFAVMNHPILYQIAGHRIETMIDTFQHGSDFKTDSSLEGREQLKINAMIIWEKNPVLGAGVNCFWVLSPFTVGRATSHCGFTEILCSFGIVGFILYYWPFVLVVFRLRKMQYAISRVSSLILLVFLITDWQGVSFLSSANVLFYAFLFSILHKKTNGIDWLN